MPVWAWTLIVVGILVVVGTIAWLASRRRRSQMLRERFGPEYDRVVTEHGGRRSAESDLAARQRRREELDIRPLEPAARERYLVEWRATQTRFVDDPAGAVAEADRLVIQVMRDRGYPMDDFDQRSADVSVDHPHVVDDYRAAHAISMASDHGQASTEDLRQAVVHYRRLFEDLLQTEDGEPAAGVG
jgi:hypothetical protein